MESSFLDLDGSVRPSYEPASKPPSANALRGCGCLSFLAILWAIASLCMALVYAPSITSMDTASSMSRLLAILVLCSSPLLLLSGAIDALSVVRNMRRLRSEPNLEDLCSDARDSVYHSARMERAFKTFGFYLPLFSLVSIVVAGKAEFGAVLSSNVPPLFGILVLFWKKRWTEWRFAQVQQARDRLASLVLGGLLGGGVKKNDQYEIDPLGGRPFILYLRPFFSTGRLGAIPFDSVLSAPIDLETRLADAVAPWGPLITLGKPGEAKGSGRKQVADEEWMNIVELACDAADSIFLIPAFQGGIMWEVELLVRKKLLDRVVFILPPTAEPFGMEWWKQTSAAMRSAGLSVPARPAANRGALFVLESGGKIAASLRFHRASGIGSLRRHLRRLIGQLGVTNAMKMDIAGSRAQ